MGALTVHLPADPVAYEDVGKGPVVILVHGVAHGQQPHSITN